MAAKKAKTTKSSKSKTKSAKKGGSAKKSSTKKADSSRREDTGIMATAGERISSVGSQVRSSIGDVPVMPLVLGAVGVGAIAAMFLMPAGTLTGMWRKTEDLEDTSLFMRIRSAIQEAANQPEQIKLELKKGIATLSGPVTTDEIEDVVAVVEKIPGIKQVVNRLEAREVDNSSQYHS